MISPCTTLYGPNNKMKEPVEMLRWLKEKGVPAAKYEKLTDPEAEGYFLTGKLVDKNVPDFNARYREIQRRLSDRQGNSEAEIRNILAGSGGQGLVLSGRIWTGCNSGRKKRRSDAIGFGRFPARRAEHRRGLDRQGEIIFQQVEQPDVIVALGDMAIKKYAKPPRIAMFYESGLADLGERRGSMLSLCRTGCKAWLPQHDRAGLDDALTDR